MKLKRTEDSFQGQKRQYMPFKLKWTCPKCGKEQWHNFSEYNYLSYPKFGEEYEVALFCDNERCNEDMEPVKTIDIVPKLDMEIEV